MVLYAAYMLNEHNQLIDTDLGPLFLDDEDFEKFNFEPQYIIDNINTDEVLQLILKVKKYYIDECNRLIKGDSNHENFS